MYNVSGFYFLAIIFFTVNLYGIAVVLKNKLDRVRRGGENIV